MRSTAAFLFAFASTAAPLVVFAIPNPIPSPEAQQQEEQQLMQADLQLNVTSSPETNSIAPSSSGHGLHPGAIAGITLGAFLGVILLGTLIRFILTRRGNATGGFIQLPFSRPHSRCSSVNSLDLESEKKLRPLVLVPTPPITPPAATYGNDIFVQQQAHGGPTMDRSELARACARILESDLRADYTQAGELGRKGRVNPRTHVNRNSISVGSRPGSVDWSSIMPNPNKTQMHPPPGLASV